MLGLKGLHLTAVQRVHPFKQECSSLLDLLFGRGGGADQRQNCWDEQVGIQGAEQNCTEPDAHENRCQVRLAKLSEDCEHQKADNDSMEDARARLTDREPSFVHSLLVLW